MSHHYSPSYTTTDGDHYTIARGIDAVEDMTRALDAQQTWVCHSSFIALLHYVAHID